MKYVFTAKEVGEILSIRLIEQGKLVVPDNHTINQITNWKIAPDANDNTIEIEIVE